MNCVSPLGKIRTVVIICCFVLIVSIFGYAYFAVGSNDVVGKDEILNNIETLENEEFDYEYVSSYIKKYGIGNVNSYKFNSIEQQLENDFYKELPEEKELAKAVSLLFLEHFYDSIDLNDKEQVTDALLKCLFASIGDPYAYYRTQEEFAEYIGNLSGGNEFVGIGIMMNAETLEILMVYPDSGASEAGIMARDVIYAVEGKTLSDLPKEELLGLLSGEADTTVNVTVRRGDELLDFTVVRRLLTERSVYHTIEENETGLKIGVIQITQFLQDTYDQFVEAVDYCTENGAEALVIDVRYNPGGLVNTTVLMIDYLVPDEEDRVIASYVYQDEEILYYTSDGHSVDLPIAVICNENSASSAELFSGALQDFAKQGCIDAVVVGKTTYGKGVLQTSLTLYDYSGITYTIGYLNPPSGINRDGIGIIPDFEVEEVPTIDAPMTRAFEEVIKLINSDGMEAVA